MKTDKKFKRQCCVCREIKNREELIRITKDYATSDVKINQNGNIQGRSVYICKNKECIENALKKKKFGCFNKFLIPDNVKQELSNLLTN